MPICFNTPSGSPTRNFNAQTTEFVGNEGEFGHEQIQFSTPNHSPTVNFNGQVRAF